MLAELNIDLNQNYELAISEDRWKEQEGCM